MQHSYHTTLLGPLFSTYDQGFLVKSSFEKFEFEVAPGPNPFLSPLRLHGTPFQREVWDLVCSILPGQTQTYGQLASVLGRPGAQRALARVLSQNPVAVRVPCHRVVGKTGLGGYRWGIDLKARLLQLERDGQTLG